MSAPRLVLLFSGHLVDAPDRPKPRFPPAKVPAAEAAIGALIDSLAPGPQDLALTQGASGGDLIFAEHCQRRGVPLVLLQPFPEAEFVQKSVLPSADGEAWRARYEAVRAKLATPPETLPAGEGDPYERCNVWLLQRAQAHGTERVRFVCLWNGEGGDGPGGTKHMVDAVQAAGGEVLRVDPAAL